MFSPKRMFEPNVFKYVVQKAFTNFNFFSLLIINVKIFPILKMNDAHLIKKNDV